jgi:hypothetical protein
MEPLECRHLPNFRADDWEGVATAFAGTASCCILQTWLDTPSPDFLSGEVKTGWTSKALWIYAVMHDSDIFHKADEAGQRILNNGDVFEIFLQPKRGGSYHEFHITPKNRTYQLFWPQETSVHNLRSGVGNGELGDFQVENIGFQSWTKVEHGLWRVLAMVPASRLYEDEIHLGGTCRFSFCRYDMKRRPDGSPKRPAVLSSTSPHRVADFHRLGEWRELIFENRKES